ncbi:MAG: polysaccharide biosynthesis/export family protein [Sedimentisphaerales bacterium]|nr:polysaccharide biosynthesis/export family protein [Sedimentisphaerales bacterium]
MKFSNLINSKSRIYLFASVCFCAVLFIIGCESPTLSDSQEVAAFNLAGPLSPEVDLDQLLSAKTNSRIYTVGAGDVLEIQMPTILTAVSPRRYRDQERQVEPYLCRVTDVGTITLPIVGQMNVDGKTLAQIEDEIVSAYYPRYILTRPSAVCSVREYHFTNITVVGAVVAPGVYKLKSNEMSLVNALMKAGGIVEDGASVITIKNPNRRYVRYAKVDQDGNEVKQWVEFGDEINEKYIESIETSENAQGIRGSSAQKTNFSKLQFDLVFQPEDFDSTKGTLIVREGKREFYSKKINLENSAQRAEYTNELKAVIGNEQGNLVGQALEQLAVQLVSTSITASQTGTLSAEDVELIDAADEFGYADIKEPAVSTDGDYPGYNQEYIETPGQEPVQFEAISDVEIIEIEPVAEIDEVEFIESEVIDEPADEFEPVEYVTEAIKGNYEPAEPLITTKPIVEPVVLPVKGLNIPFADIPLIEGDLVEVKRLNPSVFTVVGLAKAPGAFPYPPDAEYNLMQALGFAGGVDLIADPRFVTVYRQDANNKVVSATFRIDKQFQAKSYNVKIKPGDVISVNVTPRTKMNTILHQVLRLNFGLYIDPFNND